MRPRLGVEFTRKRKPCPPNSFGEFLAFDLYMPVTVYTDSDMEIIKIYQCLCDRTRLRLLNLLAEGELCVCHLQTILGEPQVKISKHLAYLRRHGLVEARKEANWMIYRLPAKRSRELAANLACLQDCVQEHPIFARDRAKREACAAQMTINSPICCPPPMARSAARNARA